MTSNHDRSRMKRLQIGAVSYLNTKPLVYGLAEQITGYADLSFDVPSGLARDLSLGVLDVALVPVIELLRNPEWRILSDACIACRGPVWSVQTLFRTHPCRVRTLAVDEGSRTSVALTQILLYERYGVVAEVRLLPLDSSVLDCDADAALVIGDRAMHLATMPDGFVERWDLGEQWLIETNLPFVFAAWIARANFADEALTRTLSTQRDAGAQHAAELAARYAPVYGLSTAAIERYFEQNLRFELGIDERQGLELFLSKAKRFGLDRGLTVLPRELERIRL